MGQAVKKLKADKHSIRTKARTPFPSLHVMSVDDHHYRPPFSLRLHTLRLSTLLSLAFPHRKGRTQAVQAPLCVPPRLQGSTFLSPALPLPPLPLSHPPSPPPSYQPRPDPARLSTILPIPALRPPSLLPPLPTALAAQRVSPHAP